jgi:hypothetical protein
MAGRLTVSVVRAWPLVSGSYVTRCGSVAVINTVVGDLVGVQGSAVFLILPSGHC